MPQDKSKITLNICHLCAILIYTYFNLTIFLKIRFRPSELFSMTKLLALFLGLMLVGCSSDNSATTTLSVDSFHACSAIQSWDQSYDIIIAPTVGQYSNNTLLFDNRGSGSTTPIFTLKKDGFGYLLPEWTQNGTVNPLLINSKLNMNDCTITTDASGNITVVTATPPNDQL